MHTDRPSNDKSESHSVFRLESVWVSEAEDKLYLDASYHIMGYYSSLGKAIAAIRLGENDYYKDEYTYAFLINEFALDDSYMVLPLEIGSIDHLHIAPTNTFPLHFPLEEAYANYLRTRLLIFQGRIAEADMSVLCEIEGHQYLYNFDTLPSKSICRRCHRKWLADYNGDLINGEIWKEVDRFDNDPRKDEELIKAWGGHQT